MTIKIPEQTKDFNFLLVGGDDGKKPIEKGWQKKIIKIDNPKLIKHLKKGGNYGVRCGSTSPIVINNTSYSLIGIDFDDAEIQEELLTILPKTFSVKTGGKGLLHLYFATDNDKSFKIFDEKMNTLLDVQGEGKQIIGAGSINPKTERAYEVFDDVPIVFIPYSELEAILKPYDKSPKKVIKSKKQYVPKGITNDFSQEIIDMVSMEEILDIIGIDTTKNPTNCFGHSSAGGKCFGWNEETAHCFHCDKSWNKYSLIREAKNLTDKETFEWFAEKCGKLNELEDARREYIESQKKEIKIEQTVDIFSRRGQIEEFWNRQPFFFDSSKMFWLWNKEEYKWILSDETDFCNLIYDTLGVETISSKSKAELVEGFKQVGRRHKPKEIKNTWIQFKDKIHDVKTGEVFEANPKYFSTNPIPWKVGKSDETPTIDKLFIEWVGKDYIDTLKEISAYNTTRDKFMQRLFALCGGGANGKGTFIKLQYKFIGKENCVSSEIKLLSENHFEASCLYKKLLCVMGEVSYDDLKNTNMLKKIAGEDNLSFQFKGKNAFTDDNTATAICLTNSLPITPDKSTGFYRKWLIVDFPNQFNEINEKLIDKIPDIEFENLANKTLKILKRLYENPIFTNEGNFEERAKKYEERSNPVMKIVEEYCIEEVGEYFGLREFTNICNKILKNRHLRIVSARQVGKILRDEGFEVGKRKKNDVSSVVIVNLSLNTEKKLPELPELPKSEIDFPCKKTNEKLGSFGSSGSRNEENSENYKKLYKKVVID